MIPQQAYIIYDILYTIYIIHQYQNISLKIRNGRAFSREGFSSGRLFAHLAKMGGLLAGRAFDRTSKNERVDLDPRNRPFRKNFKLK